MAISSRSRQVDLWMSAAPLASWHEEPAGGGKRIVDFQQSEYALCKENVPEVVGVGCTILEERYERCASLRPDRVVVGQPGTLILRDRPYCLDVGRQAGAIDIGRREGT